MSKSLLSRSLLVACIAVSAASCARRELTVIDGAGKLLSEVEASVLKGDGTVLTAVTDKRGKADFGTGKWTAINQWLSVKLTYRGEAICDQVSKAQDSTGMSITIARQP